MLKQIFAISLILIAALPNWPWPMHGDQILFIQGAESLAQGELLYRDFWDLKQPGIIVYYYLSGKLFQFNEWGIHQAETLFWVGVGLLLMFIWPRVLGRDRANLWPVVTVPVWYYAVTGSMHHTQVESIIGPFLLLHWWILWFFFKTARFQKWSWFVAGGVASIILLFKFMFLPLLGVAWLHAWYTQQQRSGWRSTVVPMIFYLMGGILFLGLSFWPWVSAYEKGELWRTFIVYPQQMMGELPSVSHQRLIDSGRWFGARFGPLLALSLLGAFSLWRSQHRSLLTFFVAWLFVNCGLIYIQKQSWWSYHFMLFLVPLGLLAAEGCRLLANGLLCKRVRYGQIILLIILLAPAVIGLGMKWSIWAKYDFAWQGQALQNYQRGEDPHYQEAFEETAFLRDGSSLPGPIFVGGEPVYYRAANRLPANAVHGWSMELYVQPVRERLTEELRNSNCVYVFINRSQSTMIAERYPELMTWLSEKFQVRNVSATGTWYERRAS